MVDPKENGLNQIFEGSIRYVEANENFYQLVTGPAQLLAKGGRASCRRAGSAWSCSVAWTLGPSFLEREKNRSAKRNSAAVFLRSKRSFSRYGRAHTEISQGGQRTRSFETLVQQ